MICNNSQLGLEQGFQTDTLRAKTKTKSKTYETNLLFTEPLI